MLKINLNELTKKELETRIRSIGQDPRGYSVREMEDFLFQYHPNDYYYGLQSLGQTARRKENSNVNAGSTDMKDHDTCQRNDNQNNRNENNNGQTNDYEYDDFCVRDDAMDEMNDEEYKEKDEGNDVKEGSESEIEWSDSDSDSDSENNNGTDYDENYIGFN